MSALLPLPRVRGGWRCIVSDPPWAFRDHGSRIAPDADVVRGRGAAALNRRLYDTMPLVEIASMPVAEIVAPSAHLYLWCPSALLAEGLVVVRAWGFRFTGTLAWDKTTKHGKPAFGPGHYFRSSHELLLFGVRGRCPALSRSERTRFEGAVGRHSQKPEVLQDMAERVSPGPRLELFARRRRPGWTCWGNQLPAELANTGTGG